jgi:hypothetical protein
MAQPRLAQITCSECNGWYISDSALREHMQTAHRRSISQHNIFQPGGANSESANLQSGTSKEGWARLSSLLRNRIQARFNPEELDTIDRFILLASQGSVFDQVCR